jgi:hypothetical protein
MLRLVEGPTSNEEQLASVVLMPAPARLGDVRANRGGRPDELRSHRSAIEQRPVLHRAMKLMSEHGSPLVNGELTKVGRHPVTEGGQRQNFAPAICKSTAATLTAAMRAPKRSPRNSRMETEPTNASPAAVNAAVPAPPMRQAEWTHRRAPELNPAICNPQSAIGTDRRQPISPIPPPIHPSPPNRGVTHVGDVDSAAAPSNSP